MAGDVFRDDTGGEIGDDTRGEMAGEIPEGR